MFGDIKDLVEMMKKSDAHLTSILKEMRVTNEHLKRIVDLVEKQHAMMKKIEK